MTFFRRSRLTRLRLIRLSLQAIFSEKLNAERTRSGRGEYFDNLLNILALARTRLEIAADVAGAAINEQAEPA